MAFVWQQLSPTRILKLTALKTTWTKKPQANAALLRCIFKFAVQGCTDGRVLLGPLLEVDRIPETSVEQALQLALPCIDGSEGCTSCLELRLCYLPMGGISRVRGVSEDGAYLSLSAGAAQWRDTSPAPAPTSFAPSMYVLAASESILKKDSPYIIFTSPGAPSDKRTPSDASSKS